MKTYLTSIARIVPLLLLITACSTTQTTLYKVWASQDSSLKKVNINQVLIVGITERPENRQTLEKSYSAEMSRIGVKSAPSLEIMDADTVINKANVKSAIENTNFDAILLTQLVRYNETDYYHGPDPEKTWSEKEFVQRIGGDPSTVYEATSDPNMITTNKVVVLKISLYDMKTEKLIWSAHSQSIEPESADAVIQSITTEVITRLKLDNVI
jgi:hypothetical protein